MLKTNDLTLGAMGCAVSVLFLLLCGYVPSGKLALGFIASFVPCILAIECSSKNTSLLSGIASALIAAFIVPKAGLSGMIIIFYCFCFCYYPWLKAMIEKKNNLVFEWALKGIYFLVISLISKFIAVKLGIYLYNMIICMIVLILYDLLLTYTISYYVKQISPRLKKSR